MTRLSPSIVGIAVACCVVWSVNAGAGLLPVQEKVNPDAQTQQDFKKRVDQYLELHKRLEKDVPPLKKKEDPAKIQASQEGLAKLIRAERANACTARAISDDVCPTAISNFSGASTGK